MMIEPTFETDRLILRSVERRDIPFIQKHFAHWEIIKNLVNVVPWPYPEDGAKSYYEDSIVPGRADGTEWSWAICLKDAPEELIGKVDLHYNQEESIHTRGFWLAQEHHRKGYMTEAVSAVTDYAFNGLGLERLVIMTVVGNKGSSRIKEKMGGVLLEVRPTDRYRNDATEEEVWELTKENWQAFRKGQRNDG